METKLITFA